MKKIIWILTVCCLSLTCFSKDDEYVGRINSVQKQSGENKSGVDTEILKINSIQSGKTFEGIMRVSMKLEGKEGRVAYGSKEMAQPSGRETSGQYKGYKASGSMNWTFEGCHGALKRPKLKAYTVEYGYKKDGEFIVLAEEFYKVDSFQALAEENKDALPLVIEVSGWYELN